MSPGYCHTTHGLRETYLAYCPCPERLQAWELRLLYSAGNPAQRENVCDLTGVKIMEREWIVKNKTGFTLK